MTDAMAIGVDGCRGGWLAVISARGRMTVCKCPTFRELAEAHPQAIIVVDVPIGLFEDPRVGGRECDQRARRILQNRSSSVFSPPARRYLASERFEDVSGMSIQAFNIRSKIREVDDFITPGLQDRILEGHPEVSFATLLGQPMQTGKKGQVGRLERSRGLRSVDGDPFARFHVDPRAALQSQGVTKIGVDDLLDACVDVLESCYGEVFRSGHLVISTVVPVDAEQLSIASPLKLLDKRRDKWTVGTNRCSHAARRAPRRKALNRMTGRNRRPRKWRICPWWVPFPVRKCSPLRSDGSRRKGDSACLKTGIWVVPSPRAVGPESQGDTEGTI